MRLESFIFVVLFTLSVYIEATSIAVTPQVVTLAKIQVSAKRFLRLYESSLQDEERGISAAGAESLLKALKSTDLADQLVALAKNSESVDDVFKLLTFEKKADELLGSAQLDDWIVYMKIFNRENRKHQVSLISTLLTHYGDDGVARMIEAAKMVPGTASRAKNLEMEQQALWLEAPKTPDDIFVLFDLDKAKDQLFAMPEVNAWMAYVDRFNKATLSKESMYTKLSGIYKEKALVDMLIAAKNVPSTEKIAIRVQAEQTQFWLKNGKSPDDIFTLLELEKAGDSLLKNSLFVGWMKYVDDFNLMNPRKGTEGIYTLTDHYSSASLMKMVLEGKKSLSTESIATTLNSELFHYWKARGSTPSNVFSLLKLKSEGDNLFESPMFIAWIQYISYFINAKPRPKVDVLAILRANFHDDQVSRILIKGAQVPGLRKIASDLQVKLILKLLKAEVDPAEVSKWLAVEGAAENNPARALYNEYVKFYEQVYKAAN